MNITHLFYLSTNELSMLGKIFSKQQFEIFFSENMVLQFMQIVSLTKCQILFSGK